MIKQINMDEYYKNIVEKKLEPPQDVKIKEDDFKGLTQRQIALINFYKTFQEEHDYRPSDYKTLIIMDESWYKFREEIKRKPNAAFNDLTSRRQLTEDKKALAFHTGTTKVFVGNGFAQTDWDIERQIIRYNITGKKAFRKMAICKMKAARNGQLGFDLNDQNEIKKYESKVSTLDTDIKYLEEQIKNGDDFFKKEKKEREDN